MRRFEQRTHYGDGWKDEWHPYVPDDVNTYGWSDADFRDFVRAENRRRKERGDNTQIRSVEIEEE